MYIKLANTLQDRNHLFHEFSKFRTSDSTSMNSVRSLSLKRKRRSGDTQ